jgi:hypothetical protein
MEHEVPLLLLLLYISRRPHREKDTSPDKSHIVPLARPLLLDDDDDGHAGFSSADAAAAGGARGGLLDLQLVQILLYKRGEGAHRTSLECVKVEKEGVSHLSFLLSYFQPCQQAPTTMPPPLFPHELTEETFFGSTVLPYGWLDTVQSRSIIAKIVLLHLSCCVT